MHGAASRARLQARLHQQRIGGQGLHVRSRDTQSDPKIDVGKGPDGIYYHPAAKRIFTNNQYGSHDITAIDAATGEVAGTVKIEGDGEEAIIGATA